MTKVQQNIKIALHFSEKVYAGLYFHGSFANTEVKEGNYQHPCIEQLVTNVIFVFSIIFIKFSRSQRRIVGTKHIIKDALKVAESWQKFKNELAKRCW